MMEASDHLDVMDTGVGMGSQTVIDLDRHRAECDRFPNVDELLDRLNADTQIREMSVAFG